MSRSFVISVLVLLLLFSVITRADEVGGVEPGGPPEPSAQTVQVQDAITGDTNVKVTQSTQFSTPVLSGVVDPGQVDGSATSTHFDSLAQGDHRDTHIQGGHNVEFNDDGTYSAESIDHLKQGIITIDNGVNVRWSDGRLTADSASSLDYKGSTSTDVVKLNADGKEFTVQKASAVQAGCFLVEDVKIAKFVVNKIVTMTTSGDGRVVYGDGSKLNYDGLQANSTLSASVLNCLKPRYTVTNMQLTGTNGNLVEKVNGSGQIDMDAAYGVVCVNLTPISTYDIDMPHIEDGFGFSIHDYAYRLCVQKNVAQKLTADCPLCGLVDLANNKLLLNGVIEYKRYQYDSALIEPFKQTAFKTTGMGKNIIDLSKGVVSVEQDAPNVDTVASNYLTLREQPVAGATHRFLSINEKLDRVSANWAKAYSTTYAQAATTIVDNQLDYSRADCHVTVLSPNSAQIRTVLSELQQQEVAFP
jgi:hypothetical protein